jgi:catechol 2,3-dioxygenase
VRLGATHLTVSDLDRSIAFHQDVTGLQVHRRDDGVAALGTGADDVLVLTEQPGARPAGRHAGLYHVALLYPSRAELARALHRIVSTHTQVEGMSDHGTHEAIYLPDPDGNGLELAADRPREAWPELTAYGIGPQPLDVRDLYAQAGEPARRAQDVRIGHLHLHVADLAAAREFYRDVVGFDVMTELPTAVFLAHGGYHHHVAANVWRGRGVPPAPADAVGLRHWTIVLEDGDDFAREEGLLRDPSGNAVLVTRGDT